MDVLREREEKDNLERQLLEEQKIRALVQKRLRREKRARRRLQDQLETEAKRRAQLEDALRAAGASDQISVINEKLAQSEQKVNNQTVSTSSNINNQSQSLAPPERDRLSERPERIKQEREDNPATAGYGQPARDVREPPPPENKPWGYSGIELMNSGAAFWQNYSDTLAQELEMERKSRQQQVEGDVKQSLQDRSGYYKNSVLFTSSAT